MIDLKRKFEHRFQVAAPIEAVAEFHGDTRALRMLTPPPMLVQFNDVEPLGEGSRADFTLWAGPVPIRWVALHSNVVYLKGFEDTQVEGPYEHWHHKHHFVAVDAQTTLVIDEIEAQLGAGVLKGLVSRLMWWSLPAVFTYRGWRTRRALEFGI